MRELNELNKVIMQKFSSRQAYTFIKGQYVPIILNSISDESQMQIDNRKYYVQNYDFTMLGYLIDEAEFEVKPAIARVLQVFEIDTSTLKKKKNQFPENPDEFLTKFLFVSGVTSLSEYIDYTANLTCLGTTNIDSYDVYINDDYFGTDVQEIQLTTNDILRIDIIKINNLQESIINFDNKLV
jgi:hypothetical protein